MRLFKRFLLLLISTAILGYVIYFIEPPKTWKDASIFQILAFFIPLLFSFTFLINLLLNNLSKSFIFSLGLMILVVLKGNDRLNPLTGVVVVIITFLLSLIFKKERLPRFNRGLTRMAKIPKLTRIGGRK